MVIYTHCVQKKVSPLKILQYHEENFTELNIILLKDSHWLTAVNDVLVKSAPFCNQMVDVTDPATVDSLLQNTPDRVVNSISWKQAISFFLEI